MEDEVLARCSKTTAFTKPNNALSVASDLPIYVAPSRCCVVLRRPTQVFKCLGRKDTLDAACNLLRRVLMRRGTFNTTWWWRPGGQLVQNSHSRTAVIPPTRAVSANGETADRRCSMFAPVEKSLFRWKNTASRVSSNVILWSQSAMSVYVHSTMNNNPIAVACSFYLWLSWRGATQVLRSAHGMIGGAFDCKVRETGSRGWGIVVSKFLRCLLYLAIRHWRS